jgi:hypothetical protein
MISLKYKGIMLWRVVAYLLRVQNRGDWRSQRAHILLSVLIIVAMWAFTRLGINTYSGPHGDGGSNLRPLLIDSPIKPFINVIGLSGSPTKGLLLYAPVLIPSIYALPPAFRTNREVALYALLLTTCAIGFFTLLKPPTDETFGCRYIYLAIALQILSIGVAFRQLSCGREIALVTLALIGLSISFLRASYYYGLQDFAAKQGRQNTLAWITGDVSKPLDLRNYCHPQLFMVRSWSFARSGVVLRIFNILCVVGRSWCFSARFGSSSRCKEHESEGNRELALPGKEVHAIGAINRIQKGIRP